MMANAEDDDKLLYVKLCELRELFSGRYTTEEAAVILQHNDGDLKSAVTFILTHEPGEVRQMLETERNSWTTIEMKTKRIRSQQTILDRARSGQIDTHARLYACAQCDNFWWRRTPQRKQVSRCNKCRDRFEAVPRQREWGWAEFHCPHPTCKREFGGWCAMYMTSPCYGCGRSVRPTRILPPDKRGSQGAKRHVHACGAPDCPGRAHYRGRAPIGPVDNTVICVHPGSLKSRGLPQVINPSRSHDSSGSTVDTFLSQTNLNKLVEDFFPSLTGIPEEDNVSLSGNDGSDIES